MNKRRWSGYWVVVLTITAGAAMAAWSQGAALHPSPVVRALAVLLGGSMLLSAQGILMGAWHWVARHAPHRDGDRHTRDIAARIGAPTPATASMLAVQWRDGLAHALRDHHGWRWRYRQPWLLLTGNDKAVARLLPSLAEDGYLVTEDAVLLWHPNDAHGQPDAARLTGLYRLRRRRPVDGVVLVVDGEEDALPPARGLSGAGAALARIAEVLRWSAPVYVLDAASVDAVEDGATPVAGCEFGAAAAPASLGADLAMLRDELARLGVQRLCAHPRDRYIAALSQRLDGYATPLASWIASLVARRLPVHGVFFTPFPGKATQSAELPPLWTHLSKQAWRDRGRRTARHPVTVCAAIALALVGLWTVGMLVSTFANAGDIRRSQDVVRTLHDGDDAARFHALLALQQRIAMYEDRVQPRTPSLRGFGLGRDRATLEALWAHYATASRALLTKPLQRSLEAALAELGRGRADAVHDSAAQQRDYRRLKAYLMLAEPARTDADFLAGQIAAHLPALTAMPPGAWQDTSERVARFFAQHLADHPAWRIAPATALVARARATLVDRIGLANADEAIYRSILDSAQGKYADLSLTALLNGQDAQGLFTTAASVPGVYTRAAWEGVIAEAIAKAADERRVESDWVLTGSGDSARAARTTSAHGPDLTQRLTARYFADYAAAWQQMLNSLRWQPAANLHAAVDQLTRLTDAQTSPLIALMASVRVQAQAGRPSQALGDTLVRRAQGLIGRDAPAITPAAAPLDAAFGPLLALTGEGDTHGGGLQSFLTAATTMRLKLQQIGNSPDAQTMARSLVQAVFQGKLSELAQVREQAALTAAGLGSAWAGFGDALFLRPLDGAWQTIVQPAAASLNDLWSASIAAPFNAAFDGRYPFHDTHADASFTELGRYVRPTSGLIPRFLALELAGVLAQQGDQWAPNGLAPQALAFDPAFLAAIQQLSVLGVELYPTGDAAYRFEIMPQPTPSVTRSELAIDRHRVVYFNQRQSWSLVVWPGDGLNGQASLTWQTIADGTREPFRIGGDWAFLRLLEKARIKPLDSTRYELAWVQPGAETLRYVLRTQLGAGPLELLKLRGFTLPERVFIAGRSAPPAMPARQPELLSP